MAEPRVIQLGNLISESNYRNPHRGRIYSVEGIAPCLNCNEGGQREVKILQRAHGFAKGAIYDICPTITTSKWQDNNFAIIEYWIRKLTPRECFRLMDVPEHNIDRIITSGISNSQLYKLAGNSIVVACLKQIFYKMFINTSAEYGAPQCHSREQPVIIQPSLSKLKTSVQLISIKFATMIKLLENTRRPDITFCRNGRIYITARVSRILSLDPGDSINIAYDNGEYLLFAVRHPNCRGRHIAQCFATKKGSHNLSANSVQLCHSILLFANVNTDRASFMVGKAFERNNTTYLPIIIKCPL